MSPHTLSVVSSTSLATLYARVIAAGWDPPLLRDPMGEALVARMDAALADSASPFHRRLLARDLPEAVVSDVALRARHFDRAADAFLAGDPAGLVVELGCGLDTRCERVADGRGEWLAFDLPAVVALREALLPPEPRRTLLAADLSGDGWWDALAARHPARPPLFLAEGLLMYLPEAAVTALVSGLVQRFPGCTLVADVLPRAVTTRLAERVFRWRARRWLHAEDFPALEGTRRAGAWAHLVPGSRLLAEWSFLDEPDVRPPWLHALRGVPAMRHLHYVVHYRLG